jgi:hypothetical protein
LVAAPRLATAAVVVAEPSGDAAPELLAELKASLEVVAAEAPAEVNAELRSLASVTDEGVELVVELVLADGSDTIRESRVATLASALPQARAMVRAAFHELMAPPPPKVVVVKERPAEPPPLVEKYDRRKALRMTVLPTLLLPIVGIGMLVSGYFIPNGTAGAVISGTGGTWAWLGLTFGPTVGYFWVGRWRHALAMMGLRLSLMGTTAAFVGIWMWRCLAADSHNEQCEGTTENMHDCHQEPSSFGLVAAIVSATALLAVTYADAFLVGRAADRANAQWRERRKLEIQAAPVVWANGRGDGTFGLAVNGSF